MTNKTKITFFIACGVAVIFIILLALGYRLQPNLTISKNGKLVLNIPFKNTEIYMDNKKVKTTTSENEMVELSLSTTNHTVTTNRDGYFPWIENIKLKGMETKEINPVFVTANTTGLIITYKDPEYWKIRNQIENQKLPKENDPIILNNNSIFVTEDNTIKIKTSENVMDIIKPVDNVKSLDFYKNRSDYVVFASDVGVYLVEISKESGTQNFYPIYKGKNPKFITKDANSLYILDGENLMAVVI